jgi:serine/threonine-protein kinase RsbW
MLQNQNTYKALAVNASHASTEVLASMHSHHPKTVMDLAEAEKVYELTTPSHTENLEPIRSFIATIAQKTGFEEMAVMAIEVAVEEACVNAIKHAHKNDATKPLHLRIKADRQKLTVVVRDQGQGFDPMQLEKQDAKVLLSKLHAGGRGILMMNMLMDEIHFAFESGKGTQVRLVKYLVTPHSRTIH